MKHRLHGLYAITDRKLASGEGIAAQVECALQGGARLIQYRDKGEDRARRIDEARALLTLCRTYGIPLIINDDLELAQECGADGVHIGRGDADLALARRGLGPEAIIGVSCYDDLQRAARAQAGGANYLAFGRFFPSGTKPRAAQADLALLHQARAVLHLPLVAIGGITPENGAQLIRAGADMLAVIQGVFGQPDIRGACREFAKLFEPNCSEEAQT